MSTAQALLWRMKYPSEGRQAGLILTISCLKLQKYGQANRGRGQDNRNRGGAGRGGRGDRGGRRWVGGKASRLSSGHGSVRRISKKGETHVKGWRHIVCAPPCPISCRRITRILRHGSECCLLS
jgi:hypothetical protein